MKKFERILAIEGLLIILLISFSNPVKAQDNISGDNQKKWSVEYSLAGTAFRIYALHGVYNFNEKSALLTGPCFQNYINDQGRAHAYTWLVGYRYNLWKGITIEYELFPAYNEFKSDIDNQYHTGFEVYSELRPGYRFDLKLGNVDLYLLPQLTIGYGIWTNNKWPDFDKQANPALMANFWVGIKL